MVEQAGGQVRYGWQEEHQRMKVEGKPYSEQAKFLLGIAKPLLVDLSEPAKRDEYHTLIDEILLTMDEEMVGREYKPLIGLRFDVARVERMLRSIDRRYGADPQDAMERKKSLLDGAYEAIQGAHDRVLGLYPQYSVPFRVPLRQSEQERH